MMIQISILIYGELYMRKNGNTALQLAIIVQNDVPLFTRLDNYWDLIRAGANLDIRNTVCNYCIEYYV